MTIYKNNNNDQQIIQFVSAPCGTGKTYATCKYIAENLDECNHMYVAPTNTLLRQTAIELENFGVTPITISSENYRNRVKREIVEILKSCETERTVLLISWAAYSEIPYFNRPENWSIYIDEMPQFDKFREFPLPRYHTILSDYIEPIDSTHNGLSIFVAKDAKVLKQRLDKPYDVAEDAAREVLKYFQNGNFDIFVDRTSWNRIAVDHCVSKDTDKNTIYTLAVLNPRLFRRATLIAANIEKSMLYHWFTEFHNVKFVENTKISSNLRKLPSNIGEKIKISYALKGKKFSKNLRDKLCRHTAFTFSELIDKAILNEIGNRKYLLVVNNDYQGPLADLETATRIPVVCHGLNQYQDHDLIVCMPALNRTPKHSWMLDAIGIDSEIISASTGYEVVYQNMMRTSLRNPDSNLNVEVIVPDIFTAEFISSLFGGCFIKRIGEIEYSKHEPLSQIERNKRTKFKNRIGQLKENSIAACQLRYLLIENNSNQIAADNKLERPQSKDVIYLTFHKSIQDKNYSDFHINKFTTQELVKFLRESSKVIVDQKDEFGLINSTVFVQSINTEGYRKKDNFKQSYMLILDFDNGLVSPDDFSRIFFENAKPGERHSFIICNSYSRSENSPNSFRVYLFYKEAAISIEEHNATYDYVENVLEENGFPVDVSGLDRNSRTGVQSFYLPSKNRNHKDSHIFETYGTQSREIDRYGLIPKEILKRFQSTEKRKLLVLTETSPKKMSSNSLVDRVEEIKAEVICLKEGRHKPFFLAGMSMAGIGLSMDEIEFELTELAFKIGKSDTRWVRDALISIKKYRFQGTNRAA